ncbi:hypothetical protein Ppa06_24920 [Planomonospora parontospora subsp. parontospora]|uniref:PknH-like extracellular domain-containing protein n=2 Tax=Planomonospora parontospora TaxID=58119 RepID=A0AA37F3U9_9ACTN|nr:hypothetical protein [Planomonospora parontospora]GGK61147.1 hypothetical protein GCM10010126_20760 [Planomonospora parontospora]GII08694.1 hypothetical protein Ppa06_24920 [Planomonospora parontospora subsp. parontospora]
MITKRSIFASLLCGVLFVQAPALAEASPEPPSPDQFKAALLLPEDLGTDFTRTTDWNRDPSQYDIVTGSKKACIKAVKGIVPLYRAKAATWLRKDDEWEGVSEYILSGTRDKISTLERAAKVMVRDCSGVTVTTDATKETIRKLSVGKLGDRVYGIKLRSGFPGRNLDKESMVAIDIVIIRVRNTLIALEHDGHVSQFDPALTKSAAETATRRLQEVLEAS